MPHIGYGSVALPTLGRVARRYAPLWGIGAPEWDTVQKKSETGLRVSTPSHRES
jgi:hypothetical protein